MPKLSKKKLEAGQALLLILLAMAVVLTLVLSGVSRSVTDIAVTSTREDSQRAFSAAESGVEQALISDIDIGETQLGNDSKFTADISGSGEGATQYLYPAKIASGDTATFWFAKHDTSDRLTCSGGGCFTGSNINICWGDDPTIDNETPAVEISVYYDTTQQGVTLGNFSNVEVARAVYDPNGPRRGVNNFAATQNDCTVDDQDLEFESVNISLSGPTGLGGLGIGCTATQGCLLMARVRMLYNNDKQSLGIITPSGLPSQGRQIVSTGTSGLSTRKIEVFETFPELPYGLDVAVYSPSDLIHQ